MNKDLEALKSDPNFIRNYTIGMQHLKNSGIFPVLRQLGGVNFGTQSTCEQVALLGARSRGFQDCIDALFNFLENHFDPKSDPSKVRMDFGSLDWATNNGYMTKEEADGIRRGEYESRDPAEKRGSAAINVNGNQFTP